MDSETNATSAAESRTPSRLSGRRLAAAILVSVAVIALITQHFTVSWRGGVLLPMGIAFLVWAALARSPGLVVPGGVLTGLGVGMALMPAYGVGALMLGMAGGFMLVALLSRVQFGAKPGGWWPLYPSVVLALVGVVMLAGPDVREWFWSVAPYWPYALLVAAVWLWFGTGGKKP